MTTNAQREAFEKWAVEHGFDVGAWASGVYFDEATRAADSLWQLKRDALASTTTQGMREDNTKHFEHVLTQLEAANYEIGYSDARQPKAPPELVRERELFRRYVLEAFQYALQSTAKPVVGE